MFTEEEKKEIKVRYKRLLKLLKPITKNSDAKMIRRALDLAIEAHADVRRSSGEPYIYHPLEVAEIVAEKVGLGPISVVCALLHDVVEDSVLTIEDIEDKFGTEVAQMIDGLTKISQLDIIKSSDSIQSENFKKLLLTLSDDVRVILIKLADRLHNMRTLEALPKKKQLKISSETSFLYAPLAHRLGLYNIKQELEDLSLKYLNPQIYRDIERNLEQTTDKRNEFIEQFIQPIRKRLDASNLKYEIKGRTKSIHSVWNKIKKQDIAFDEVYDLFAIRIIIDTKQKREKSDSWRVYSIVTDFYQPNPKRLRDWISIPKSNGYESLHTTVMGPGGKWVEVQIRSKRMDEIAEKGLAAHWKYKGSTDSEEKIEHWLNNVREIIENPNLNAIDFVDDFKLQLYANEVFVFTPKGDLKKLPLGATILDFAYDIHTDVGSKCVSGKANNKIVPIRYQLNSGDQVEIITSNSQKPSQDWLEFVITSKARSKIKKEINDQKYKDAEIGKEILQRKLKNWKLEYSDENVSKLLQHFKIKTALDLYYLIGTDKIDLLMIKEQLLKSAKTLEKEAKEEIIPEEKTEAKENQKGVLIVDQDIENVNYKFAKCCNPVYGDEVFGFITVSKGITVHRVNCPNAPQMLARYGYRIINVDWEKTGDKFFFKAAVNIKGIDRVGMLNDISQVISNNMNVNMKAVSIDSKDGLFEGNIIVNVFDTRHLDVLLKKLSEVEGVLKVNRREESESSKNAN